MELHAEGGMPAVAKAHDNAIRSPRGSFQLRVYRFGFDHQRMVSGGLEGIGQALEWRPAVVANFGGLAVDGMAADNSSAECVSKALMPKANAKDGNLPRQLLDRRGGDSRVGWATWTGRHDQRVMTRQLVDVNCVIAIDAGNGAEHREQLYEVVGEGIVIVDHGNAGHAIASASSMALNMAPAFSSVSSYSRSGRESATTPAPDW